MLWYTAVAFHNLTEETQRPRPDLNLLTVMSQSLTIAKVLLHKLK